MEIEDPEATICMWCGKTAKECTCNEPMACGIENPEQCDSCT